MNSQASLFTAGSLPPIQLPNLPERYDPDAHDPNVYDPKRLDYRIAYAARAFRTGLASSTRTFDTTTEMGDGEDVIDALLALGATDERLREGMHRSRCANLAAWLRRFPEHRSAYNAIDPKYAAGTNRA